MEDRRSQVPVSVTRARAPARNRNRTCRIEHEHDYERNGALRFLFGPEQLPLLAIPIEQNIDPGLGAELDRIAF